MGATSHYQQCTDPGREELVVCRSNSVVGWETRTRWHGVGITCAEWAIWAGGCDEWSEDE